MTETVLVKEKLASRCRRFLGRFLALFKKKHRRHSHKKNGGVPEHPVTDLTCKTDSINETQLLENNEEDEVKVEVNSVTTDVQEEEQTDLKAENVSALKEELEPQVVKAWAEEVDDAEELGLDVFAETSGTVNVTPVTVIHSGITASTACEAECKSAAHSNTKAAKRRRARRVAAAAARREFQASCAVTTSQDAAAREYYQYYESSNQDEAAREYYWYYYGANYDAAEREYYEYYYGADHDAAAREYYEYYYGADQDAFARDYDQRVMQRQQRDMVPTEVPYMRPTRPSPSVRVFGRDGRPLVCQWEDGYAAFHAQRHTQAKAGH